MITVKRHPMLWVVSAPSGAGKTTLCDRLVADEDTITYSVSCTTRAPRAGEIDGKSYFFLSESAFDARVATGEFLEHAVVHGNRYGTLVRTVRDAMAAGRDVLMDIDVQGAAQIRAALAFDTALADLRAAYVDIFIAPPSLRDLQLRLWGRGQDDEAVIEKRLAGAADELGHWRDYQYVIVNDQLETSYRTLHAIWTAECRRTQRLAD